MPHVVKYTRDAKTKRLFLSVNSNLGRQNNIQQQIQKTSNALEGWWSTFYLHNWYNTGAEVWNVIMHSLGKENSVSKCRIVGGMQISLKKPKRNEQVSRERLKTTFWLSWISRVDKGQKAKALTKDLRTFFL